MAMEGSPIEKLVSALESEAVDPVTIAAEALSKVNGNASRNSYITVDATWTRDQSCSWFGSTENCSSR